MPQTPQQDEGETITQTTIARSAGKFCSAYKFGKKNDTKRENINKIPCMCMLQDNYGAVHQSPCIDCAPPKRFKPPMSFWSLSDIYKDMTGVMAY